jgi:hypothetical protein
MRHAKLLMAGTALCSALLCTTGTAALELKADLILHGGEFYTPDGWAQAIAIQNGVIIAVGDEAEVNAMREDHTRMLDLNGAAVFPGLNDLHVHPTGAGMSQLQCRFPQGSTKQQIITAVRACAEQRADGEWITGGQWDASSYGPEAMDRAPLDEAAPNNPVALTDISGHSLWANSRALEIAGITATTPNPPGGIIEHDAGGRVSGVLRESANGLVRRVIPPATPEQVVQALRWSLDLMLSYGITSFTDAGVDGTTLQAYATLADQGVLKQRVTTCMMWRRASFGGSDAGGTPDYVEQRMLYTRERLSPTCIKLVLDGVPTDGHTAAMVEPYEDSHNETGLLMIPGETLNPFVTELDALGFTVKMHAAGDGAVRAGLNAIEAARLANGYSGQLHDVAHNSFVQMTDIRRARAMAATFEMSPYIWYPNPIIPDIAKAVGAERMKRWIPLKDAIAAGALVVPGSDWPVVPEVNPWLALETLVTRQVPGGGGETLGASQKITLKQAFDLYTVNAARQLGKRDRSGTIARGMLADLVVVDRNPFEIPITEVHQTQVLMTLIEGEVVYRSSSNR